MTLFLDLFRWFFWNVFPFFHSIVPRSALMALIDGPVSRLYTLLDKKRTTLLGDQLRRLPCTQANICDEKTIIRRSFAQLIKLQVETFDFHKLHSDNIDKFCRIVHLEHLDEGLAKGKGAIVLNSHFGNFQMVIAALGHQGYTVGQLAVRIEEDPEKYIEKDSLLSRIHVRSLMARQRLEEALPVTFLHVSKFMRSTYRLLQKNDILIVAADGRQGAAFISTQFLGRTAYFSTGPFELAYRTGASIIPSLTLRQRDHSHLVYMFPELCLSRNLPPKESIAQALQLYVTLLEQYVCKYPCHYLQYLSRCVLLLRDDEQSLFENSSTDF